MTDLTTQDKSGWAKVAFGDVVRKVSDRVDPASSGLERYVAGEHMVTDELKITNWGLIGEDYLGPAFHMRFKPGQVLYGSRRTYLRKVALPDFEGITANTTYVLESSDPSKLMPELLPYLMQTESFHAHSIANSKGSVNPYVNYSDIACFEFMLPPLQEQARIVDAMAALIRLGDSYRTMERAAKKLRLSLMSKMDERCELIDVEGLLDRGAIAPPQDGNHGELHPKSSDYVEEGIPFVMASDLVDGIVDFEVCKKLPQSLTDQLRIGFANTGDILLSHKGTVGSVAIVPEHQNDYVMLTPQVTYYRVIDEKIIHPLWLFYAFQTPKYRLQLRIHERQSTRPYVGITVQRTLNIPFCDRQKQSSLIKELQSIDGSLNQIKQRIRKI